MHKNDTLIALTVEKTSTCAKTPSYFLRVNKMVTTRTKIGCEIFWFWRVLFFKMGVFFIHLPSAPKPINVHFFLETKTKKKTFFFIFP